MAIQCPLSPQPPASLLCVPLATVTTSDTINSIGFQPFPVIYRRQVIIRADYSLGLMTDGDGMLKEGRAALRYWCVLC